MKKYLLTTFIILFVLQNTNAQTGIGTTTPNASAKLDVYSTNKGFLPPRVTLTSVTDASTIASPAEGLLVYNLGSVGLQAGYYYWNGASWATIATASSAGNGVTASDMVKLYGEAHSSATGKISSATGYVFTVPVSGRYLFDFTSSATALGGGTNTIYFQVRQGTTVLGSDMQSSYNNNVHVEYNGKVEVNLQSGVSYNVYNYATSGSFEANDYDRVYYKLVAGNLPVTGQSVDYIQASLSSNQTLSSAGNIIFNVSSGAGITLTSGGFNLLANKTYKLEAALGGASGGYAYYGWVDNSNTLLPGGSIGVIMKAGSAYADAPQDNAVVYYTPSANTTVYLRVLNVSGGVTAYAPPAANNFSSTWATISQVGSSAFVNPWILSGNNVYNNTGKVGIGNTSPTQALDVTGTGKFSTSIINSGNRTYFGKDGSNMHWFGTTDGISEPNNLGYGFESNGTSIQSHKWYIGGSEKMRISSSGNLGLGTTTASTSLHIENGNLIGSGNPASTSGPSLYVYNNNNASNTANATALVRTAGTGSGKPYYSLDVNGAFGYSMGINNPTEQFIINSTWNFATGTASNNAIIINRSGQTRVAIPASNGSVFDTWPSGWGGGIATYDFACAGIYYQTLTGRSDRRLKNTIMDLDQNMISNYLELRPVNFYWNDGSDNKRRQYGLIAQEVEALFPDIVSVANDSMQTKSVNYQALHALSLKVIQSQQVEIEKLKKKQQEIEARLLKLEAKLN